MNNCFIRIKTVSPSASIVVCKYCIACVHSLSPVVCKCGVVCTIVSCMCCGFQRQDNTQIHEEGIHY